MATGAGERDGTITTEVVPGSWVVRLHGEHDVATAPALRAAIAETPPGGDVTVLDLRACTFVDSSVISELLAARRGRPVRLLLSPAPDDPVRRTLDLCGVLGSFEVGGGEPGAQADPA